MPRDVPAARNRARERPPNRAGNPGPQPFQPVGPLLRRRLPAPEGAVHGEVAALLEPGDRVHLPARRRLPDPARLSRRGGVHDCVHHPRARRLHADVPGGRTLSDRWPSRTTPGGRADRAAVGRSRHSGGDPRLARRPQMAQAALPQGHGSVRRAAGLRCGRGAYEGAADRGRDAGLRARSRDVRRARGKGSPRRDQVAARGDRRPHGAQASGGPGALAGGLSQPAPGSGGKPASRGGYGAGQVDLRLTGGREFTRPDVNAGSSQSASDRWMQIALTRTPYPVSAALGAFFRPLLVLLVELRPLLRVVARHDHGLGVLAVEEAQLLKRAAPKMRVRRSWLTGATLELANRVDGVARDHEIAVAKPHDHTHVAERMAGGEREADAAVTEQVERAPEGGVGLDVAAVEVDQAVVEGVVVVRSE